MKKFLSKFRDDFLGVWPVLLALVLIFMAFVGCVLVDNGSNFWGPVLVATPVAIPLVIAVVSRKKYPEG